jgi:hypothetical protein
MRIFLLSIIAVGCSLSAVAAFYSIGGLVKIFKGNETSIIILASALEIAKVLISVYLHIYWDRARKLLISYLTFALVILAFITSLGIFGALSSAYFNSTDTEQLNTKISIIQSQIEIEQSKIKNGMNQISAIASIPKEEKQSWHYFKINSISKEIDGYTKNIDEFNERLMPIKAELNRMNTEVGPLRYLAGWIYGDVQDATDKAVQLFIVMLVTVFDPLALLLIFAGIHAFEIEKKKEPEAQSSPKVHFEKFEIQDVAPAAPVVAVELDDEPFFDDYLILHPQEEVIAKPVKQSKRINRWLKKKKKPKTETQVVTPVEVETPVEVTATEAEVKEDEEWAVKELLANSFEGASNEIISDEDASRLLKLLGKDSGKLESEDIVRLLKLLGKDANAKLDANDVTRLLSLVGTEKKPKRKPKKKLNVIDFPSADEREVVTHTNNSEFDSQLKNINYIS